MQPGRLLGTSRRYAKNNSLPVERYLESMDKETVEELAPGIGKKGEPFFSEKNFLNYLYQCLILNS